MVFHNRVILSCFPLLNAGLNPNLLEFLQILALLDHLHNFNSFCQAGNTRREKEVPTSLTRTGLSGFVAMETEDGAGGNCRCT